MLLPWILRRRRLRALALTPVTAIAALTPGTRARITGRVRRFEGPERQALTTLRTMPARADDEAPFPATYTGRPCVFVASQARDARGLVVEARQAGVRFVVTDATGAAVVDLRHVAVVDDLAEVAPRTGTFRMQERCFEWTIELDQQLTVLGVVAAPEPGLPTVTGSADAPALVAAAPRLT
ncbi:MAG: hypothetical protein R3B06_01340 [Kofleriaceae bacterium]